MVQKILGKSDICEGCITTRGCSGGKRLRRHSKLYGVGSGGVGKELPRVEPVNVCPLGRTCPKHLKKRFQDAYIIRRYLRVNHCCTKELPRVEPVNVFLWGGHARSTSRNVSRMHLFGDRYLRVNHYYYYCCTRCLSSTHLQILCKIFIKGKQIKERNTCGYRNACISKDD